MQPFRKLPAGNRFAILLFPAMENARRYIGMRLNGLVRDSIDIS